MSEEIFALVFQTEEAQLSYELSCDEMSNPVLKLPFRRHLPPYFSLYHSFFV